ncbi:hypothetical protein [Rhizobium leguminosarum]|uniref:hypothetical protein n=2 Tax=Rhizobium leguminosarum TaxID=384 RepID=UPI00098EBF0C|nr:hypothetical protein [Rhizobium leguminosarum]MBB5255312.1 hypothetical protein [Rhizobium leguminosarum]MDX6000655.1 hypothetical protein [Rhizobium leguminosarum]OOO44637.1 hypothetical protein BS629_31540 [Rhizobium leguminosarum bv. viciae USDA 2370]PUB62626.1 hypothetical protein DB728_12670 [Rhizobium leguminosarum bv. viciae USDA 2370]TBZ50700.1 hypothetical protein E0H42_20880 [Rhizobium leguminosarum bv. viciae]
MPKLSVAMIFLVTLWTVSAEKSFAAMWLVRGPANTSMAADPACKVRDNERSAPDDHHLWIDCGIGEKHVTLLISSVAPFVAKDFTFKNAVPMFEKITAGTEWSAFKDKVKFIGGTSFAGFEPFAQMRLIGRLCDVGEQCPNPRERIVALKMLGTSRVTVSLIVMGDVEPKDYIVHGKRVATYRYFPDPIATMVDTFNFATIQNAPY